MGPEARREYLARMRERYVVANRREKGRLLEEAVAVSGGRLRETNLPPGQRAHSNKQRDEL